MKKILTILGSLAFACNAFASVPNLIGTEHFVVGASVYSLDAPSAENLDFRRIAQSYDVTFKITDHLYNTNGTDLEQTSFQYHSTLGVTGKFFILKPYAELSYREREDNIDYDVGVMIHTSNIIRPFVEIKNFIDKPKKREIFGIQLQTGTHMYAEVSYEINPIEYSDNIKVSLNLQI